MKKFGLRTNRMKNGSASSRYAHSPARSGPRAGFSLLLVCSLSVLGAIASGCSISAATPTALPTVVLDQASAAPDAVGTAPGNVPLQLDSGGVIASGIVVPAEEAHMVFSSGGRVMTVDVAAGDRVEAGQVLVTLAGSEKLAAAVEAANLELLEAQQAYDYLYDDLDGARNQALLALNSARQAARDAERRLSSLSGTPNDADIDIARSQLIFAENDLKDAQEKYKRFDHLPEDNLARARYRVVLAETQKKYDQALRKYNSLTGTVNDFDRQQAETDLEIAKKQLELAQKDFDLLQQGPDPDLVEAAGARIRNAQAQLDAGRAALADLELRAPFPGTIGRVNVHSGEWVTPGQPILVLVDLDHLRVETTDLSERDVPKIEKGQPVTVLLEALNRDVPGRVVEISPLADTLGGDVVYKTTIDLQSQPSGLRAGMSVEVQFGSNPE